MKLSYKLSFLTGKDQFCADKGASIFGLIDDSLFKYPGTKLVLTSIQYLLLNLDVKLVSFSMPANQREQILKILDCDWLQPKVRQDGRRGRLEDIIEQS